MTRRVRFQRLALLTLAMALATVALGWPGPLLVAIVFAIIDRHATVAAEACTSAAIAWALLFTLHAVIPGAGMVGLVGRAMAIPAIVLPLVTIVFPALLAWSGATAAVAILRGVGQPRRPHHPADGGAVAAQGD